MGYLSELKLPLLGETMETGRITEWCVQPGEAFERGQVLLEVETDKTIVEVPALQQGTFVEVVAPAGTQVSVGAVIAQIELPGTAPVVVVEKVAADEEKPSKPAAALPISRTAGQPLIVSENGQRRFVTPRARRTARQYGIEVTAIDGTGRRGRVTQSDVVKAAAARALVAPVIIDVTASDISGPMGQIHRTHWMARDVPINTSAEQTTVVLLHGLFGDSHVWTDVASQLLESSRLNPSESGRSSAGLTVCALDLPGHGSTASQASAHDDVCEAVIGAIQDYKNIILVGHSYGGGIAASVAAALQQQLAGLVLVAPAGLGSSIDQHFLDTLADPQSDESQVSAVLAGLTASGEPLPDNFVRALSNRLKVNSAQLQAQVNEIASNGQQTRDIRQTLATLNCPLSIIWGREDNIIDSNHALTSPKNANVTLLAKTGHMPHREKPIEVAGVIERFLMSNNTQLTPSTVEA